MQGINSNNMTKHPKDQQNLYPQIKHKRYHNLTSLEIITGIITGTFFLLGNYNI